MASHAPLSTVTYSVLPECLQPFGNDLQNISLFLMGFPLTIRDIFLFVAVGSGLTPVLEAPRKKTKHPDRWMALMGYKALRASSPPVCPAGGAVTHATEQTRACLTMAHWPGQPSHPLPVGHDLVAVLQPTRPHRAWVNQPLHQMRRQQGHAHAQVHCHARSLTHARARAQVH